MKPAPLRQTGFSLVIAIFVLVISSTLGAYLVRISALQHTQSALSLQSLRAHFAACSGLEWALFRVLHQPKGGFCQAPPGVITNVPLVIEGLPGFAVKLTCYSTEHVEGTTPIRTFQLSAQGSYGSLGELDFVSRTLHASLSCPNPNAVPPCKG